SQRLRRDRRGLQCLLVPVPAGQDTAPVEPWRPGNDAIEVFRVALRFHGGLAPSVRPPCEVGVRWTAAISSLDDALGRDGHHVNAAMAPVNLPIRATQRPRGIQEIAALVPGGVANGRIYARQSGTRRGNRAHESAPTPVIQLAVPGGRQPQLEVDLGLDATLNLAVFGQ